MTTVRWISVRISISIYHRSYYSIYRVSDDRTQDQTSTLIILKSLRRFFFIQKIKTKKSLTRLMSGILEERYYLI